MASKAQIKANAKYDKAHTTNITLKLNLKTDKDILDRLASVPNRQGYIKQLIRDDMNRTGSVHGIDSAQQNSDSVPVSFKDPYSDIIAKAVGTWIDNATSVLSDNKPYIVSDSVPENAEQ